jgi:O-6-methylguanine DNA methyltransferase
MEVDSPIPARTSPGPERVPKKASYITYPSEIGEMIIVSTEEGICLSKLNEDLNKIRTLMREYGIGLEKDITRLKEVKNALDAYFSGERVEFRFSVHFIFGTKFQVKVWKAVRKIPYGETRTYKQVAADIGKPRAYRAVGNALRKNPVILFVPCHRVIRSDRSLGGFGYGLEVKGRLLELEGCLKLLNERERMR